MRWRIAALAGIALFFSAADGAPMHARRTSDTTMTLELKATKDTVHWGYFSKEVAPSLTMNSGETVRVEMVSVSSPACHACDALSHLAPSAQRRTQRAHRPWHVAAPCWRQPGLDDHK